MSSIQALLSVIGLIFAFLIIAKVLSRFYLYLYLGRQEKAKMPNKTIEQMIDHETRRLSLSLGHPTFEKKETYVRKMKRRPSLWEEENAGNPILPLIEQSYDDQQNLLWPIKLWLEKEKSLIVSMATLKKCLRMMNEKDLIQMLSTEIQLQDSLFVVITTYNLISEIKSKQNPEFKGQNSHFLKQALIYFFLENKISPKSRLLKLILSAPNLDPLIAQISEDEQFVKDTIFQNGSLYTEAQLTDKILAPMQLMTSLKPFPLSPVAGQKETEWARAVLFGQTDSEVKLDQAEIKNQYKSLVKSIHPDRIPPEFGDEARKIATENLAAINRAYELLKL